MGERIALGLVAVLALGCLSGAAVPAQAGPAVAAVAAPAVWQPTMSIEADRADRIVAETAPAEPDARPLSWASCALPINIDYSVEPGIDASVVRNQLAYPVRYFQDLGYYAAIGVEVPYAPSLTVPTAPGSVLVVVESNAPRLKENRWRAVTDYSAPDGKTVEAARITVDSVGGLSSDVLLHELGHVAGLQHKEGTVMDIPAAGSPIWFDAAETAAIDCRG